MSYKYLHPTSKFTTQQKDFYEQNGYIIIRNNVNHELLDKCCERFVEIAEGTRPIQGSFFTRIVKDPVLKEKGIKGEHLVNKIQDFIEDDILGQYARYKTVLEVVQNIIGPNITAFNSMIINKPPDSNKEVSKHPLHQDLFYFPFRPPEKIVASWTAMEKVDVENGCLFVIPGSHNSPLYSHDYQQNVKHALYVGLKEMDNLPTVDVIMDKGDTIFFHPLIMHGSHPNCSKRFRKAISVHYADSNCHFIDTTNTPHEKLIKEIEKEMLRIFNSRISYSDYVRGKSVLIQGPPGNFQKFDSHL